MCPLSDGTEKNRPSASYRTLGMVDFGWGGCWSNRSAWLSREKRREEKKSSELVLMTERLWEKDTRRCTGLSSATLPSLLRFPTTAVILGIGKEIYHRQLDSLVSHSMLAERDARTTLGTASGCIQSTVRGSRGIIGIHLWGRIIKLHIHTKVTISHFCVINHFWSETLLNICHNISLREKEEG